jgi:ABC-type glycerol-3-phosphate transport system substrate-binding protein
VIPKGAKNIAVAKAPQIFNRAEGARRLSEGGLGRFLPTMPSIARDDPGFWLDPKNEPLAAYTRQGILGPTIPPYEVLNPAMAEVWTGHVFSVAMFDVMNGGLAPEQAIDKAFKGVERSSRNTRFSRLERHPRSLLCRGCQRTLAMRGFVLYL